MKNETTKPLEVFFNPKVLIFFTAILLLCFLLLKGNLNVKIDSEDFVCGQTVEDVDGNEYKTIKIGDQCWFAENLKVSRYNDGTKISEIKDHDTWWNDRKGALSLYDYTAPFAQSFEIKSQEEMFDVYGYLYNFHAAVNKKGLCPDGWSVPSDEDWKILEIELGMDEGEIYNYWHRGTDEGGKLKGGLGFWDREYDLTGFNALPAGYRRNYGDFGNIGSNANFWTSTAIGNEAIRRNLYWEDAGIYRVLCSKENGLSVRCLKDVEEKKVFNLSSEIINYNEVNLQWINNDEGVEKYIIYRRKKGEDFEKIGSTLEKRYKDVVDFNASYYYMVTYVVDGREGGPSRETMVTIEPFRGWVCGDLINYHGDEYKTVEIGGQCWFAENLKTKKYKDGRDIINPIEDSDWRQVGYNKDGAYSCYGHEEENCDTYGALYNAYAVAEGLCPDGWSVPSDEDWKILEMELGMDEEKVDRQYWRGEPIGVTLMGRYDLWKTEEIDKNFGLSGFEALPGGYRMSEGRFGYLGIRANIWSSTIRASAWRRTIMVNSSTGVRRTAAAKNFGFSVRCLKD